MEIPVRRPPRRRPNGQGSVWESAGKWRVAFVERGKRRHYSFATRQEAEDARSTYVDRRLTEDTWEAIRAEVERCQQSPTGWIYCIAADDVRRYKIGYTANTAVRFKRLRSTSPVDVRLAGVMPGTMELERFLQRTFAEFRAHHEWFYGSIHLDRLIEDYMEDPAPGTAARTAAGAE